MQNKREAFENAYAEAYPTTCQLVDNVFEFEYGEYTRTPVQVGWVMWQAGAQHERNAQPGELCPACAASEFERVSGFGGLT